LDIGFGPVDGSWKGGGITDGVCFRVSAAGLPSPLWSFVSISGTSQPIAARQKLK
jgi:hypothetical protein